MRAGRLVHWYIARTYMAPSTQQVFGIFLSGEMKSFQHLLAGWFLQWTSWFLWLNPLSLKASLTLAPDIFLTYNLTVSYPSLKNPLTAQPYSLQIQSVFLACIQGTPWSGPTYFSSLVSSCLVPAPYHTLSTQVVLNFDPAGQSDCNAFSLACYKVYGASLCWLHPCTARMSWWPVTSYCILLQAATTLIFTSEFMMSLSHSRLHTGHLCLAVGWKVNWMSLHQKLELSGKTLVGPGKLQRAGIGAHFTG